MVKLRPSDNLEDWFVLEGGTNWAVVEGTAEEWRAIAEALKAPSGERDGASFRRCACLWGGTFWTFYSPRNSRGDADDVYVSAAKGDALADQILETLAAAKPK